MWTFWNIVGQDQELWMIEPLNNSVNDAFSIVSNAFDIIVCMYVCIEIYYYAVNYEPRLYKRVYQYM
jgi:hypothetical protein